MPKELLRHLTSYYPGALGKSINQAINSRITVTFNYVNAMQDTEYFKQIEQIFNVDEQGLKEFAFMIFDSNNDGLISEMDLLELMKSSAQQKFYHKGDVSDIKRNDKIRSLKDKIEDEDVFLKFFLSDYILIIKKMKGTHGS